MVAVLGILTIGQSPRTDVQPILEEILSEQMFIQKGALDEFTKDFIEEHLAPSDPSCGYVLTSRLKDGNYVSMDRRKLQPFVQNKIDEFEREGVQYILLLCTGIFKKLKTNTAQIIEPDHIIPPIVKLMLGNKRLGVIVPLKEQINNFDDKFTCAGLEPIFSFASPYVKNREAFHKAGLELKEKTDLILMDCMGYTEEMRQWIVEDTNKPTILSNALIAKVISVFI
ncbi:AroM family protein [Sporolactobacillus terrae]|uniref:AroM protein n=1 Tax=Sporolactobacillus terrae TaxID=269673 RepID=A0ABX5Q4Q7_9BACL|nr:AroM family protein [Sporolactobacillus terrae]QAA21632.1 AroM protein [Sporolactobacillus terrae]QAA24604.1 AroM protein [Sporolactobacillus terrae]UAK16441.1 AroM family protein [Sporolactobacillus terrae]